VSARMNRIEKIIPGREAITLSFAVLTYLGRLLNILYWLRNVMMMAAVGR
jgi:hypothetical protein